MNIAPTSQQGSQQKPDSVSGATERQAAPRSERAEARERPRVVTPPIDVFESDDALLVVLDVPGVTAADLTVRLEKDELFVQARRGDLGPAPLEYRRIFAVPRDVDGEAITADLTRGVLELTLPRKASAKPRQIPIRSA